MAAASAWWVWGSEGLGVLGLGFTGLGWPRISGAVGKGACLERVILAGGGSGLDLFLRWACYCPSCHLSEVQDPYP